MIIIKTQAEAEAMVKDGVLRVDDDLKIECNISIEADINAGNINAGNIDALNINAGNIDALDIDALDINAGNIDAGNINAWNIDAWNIDAKGTINFYAICIAYGNIVCKSYTARRENHIIKSLDGEIITKGEK